MDSLFFIFAAITGIGFVGAMTYMVFQITNAIVLALRSFRNMMDARAETIRVSKVKPAADCRESWEIWGVDRD